MRMRAAGVTVNVLRLQKCTYLVFWCLFSRRCDVQEGDTNIRKSSGYAILYSSAVTAMMGSGIRFIYPIMSYFWYHVTLCDVITTLNTENHWYSVLSVVIMWYFTWCPIKHLIEHKTRIPDPIVAETVAFAEVYYCIAQWDFSSKPGGYDH